MFLEKFQEILLWIAVIFAIAGLYLTARAWLLWKNMNNNVLRAKVFLTKSFLHTNLMLIFIVVVFIALHVILEFIEHFGYFPFLMQFEQTIDLFYILALTVTMFFLVLLAHNWRRLLSSSK